MATCGGQIPAEPQPGDFKAVSIQVNDSNLGVVQRTFGIYIPDNYSKDTKLPLVMVFHESGASGSSGCQRGFCAISEDDSDGPFIVVQARKSSRSSILFMDGPNLSSSICAILLSYCRRMA